MAFSVMLYRNNSEVNRMDKDLTLLSTQLNTMLKDAENYSTPTITLNVTYSSLTGTNYVYIEPWQRYYFVTKRTYVRYQFTELELKCDVLMSFKTQIRACTGIVKRQENKWNLYLNDGSFKVYQNPLVLTKKFPSGFSTQSFVLAVAGG